MAFMAASFKGIFLSSSPFVVVTIYLLPFENVPELEYCKLCLTCNILFFKSMSSINTPATSPALKPVLNRKINKL